jgi:hypothetical protein
VLFFAVRRWGRAAVVIPASRPWFAASCACRQVTGDHSIETIFGRIRSRTELFAFVLRDPGRSFSGGRSSLGVNHRNARRDPHREHGAIASPPDRWGRPQTEVSGRPDCGPGSRTSRGAFHASRSRTSRDPHAATTRHWLSSVPSLRLRRSGTMCDCCKPSAKSFSFDSVRCRSSPAGAGRAGGTCSLP